MLMRARARAWARCRAWAHSTAGRIALWAWLALFIAGLSLEAGIWSGSAELHPPYLPVDGRQWQLILELKPPVPELFNVRSDTSTAPRASGLALRDSNLVVTHRGHDNPARVLGHFTKVDHVARQPQHWTDEQAAQGPIN